MNKGLVFWVVCGLVLLASGAGYLVVVRPQMQSNEIKLEQRDLLAARLRQIDQKIGEVERPTETIKSYFSKSAGKSKKQPSKGKEKEGEERGAKLDEFLKKLEELFPDSALKRDTDAKLCGLYPLTGNLKHIPNNASVEVAKREDALLTTERGKFLKLFETMQFSVDQSTAANTDFVPAPDQDEFRFLQWVMGSAEKVGQDQKTDRMLEEKLGKGCMAFRESRLGTPGQPCEWLEDGRCSGYITNNDRALVLRRLMLRRLIFAAVGDASAPVRTLVGDDYKGEGQLVSSWEIKQRRVQAIDALVFLDGDSKLNDPSRGFIAARNQRFRNAGLQPPVKAPAPYKADGFVLRLKCHPAVVPAVILRLEEIGKAPKRPFCCWVERVVIDRLPGKPDWKLDAEGMARVEDLPKDGGNRYKEWPVSVELLCVVPEFDGKLDPAP